MVDLAGHPNIQPNAYILYRKREKKVQPKSGLSQPSKMSWLATSLNGNLIWVYKSENYTLNVVAFLLVDT
jgi:hypothetical protein